MNLFLNSLGASAGAGLTYLYNVVPQLSALPNVSTTLAVQPELRPAFRRYAKVDTLHVSVPQNVARRFCFEQRILPELVRESGADVLISAGNFAVRNSPVPQILLSGNSLYTSCDFARDLRARHEYGMWLDTRLKGWFARKSVGWADCTIAPTEAYASELRKWAGGRVLAVHHGFEPDLFFGDPSPLPLPVQDQLRKASGALRLLFVSHYNYYRNFETLFRGVALLRERLHGRKVRLFLTCKLRQGSNPGTYKTRLATDLIRELGIQAEIVELGAIPYRLLHHLYRACDVYVTAAYTETFAHPLVEAMASGIPVVASDLQVHREVCGNYAAYFPAFSPENLADKTVETMQRTDRSVETPKNLSWAKHVRAVLAIADSLVRERRPALMTHQWAV